ncbi:hypothetical protein [Enterobacter cloacae complex sp. ESBL7]|uniref:hypothetical protein n=1 Tax=Enterobacter cloacae complex sp. ESBL7 TaxID=3163325 RepID=UPI003568F691
MENTFKHASQMVWSWLQFEKQDAVSLQIAEKLHEIDTKASLLLRPGSSDTANNTNRQRLFRTHDGWINGNTLAQRTKFLALLPAIERAMLESGKSHLVMLVMKMRSHTSPTIRELVQRRERIDNDMDALFGAMISMSERHYGSGPAGNSLFH